MTNKTILMTLIIAMTFLIGFSAQEAFSEFPPAIYEEPLDGTILNLLFLANQPVADDFVIGTTTTITDFHVLLIEIPGGFDGNVQYAIYEDDNGLPGALVQDGSGVAQDGETEVRFDCVIGIPCFDFWANLETPVPLEPGTYWIEFSGQSASWAVALDDVFFGSEAAFFSGNWFPLTIVFGFPVGVSFSITGEADLPPPGVEIDIKPGSDPNSINTKSMGVVPVAILGSADFDVTEVDVSTLTFGPDSATPAHDLSDPDTYADHLQDVNGDGFLDLVSHYKQKEVGLCVDNTEATISGTLLDGTPFEGTDSVRLLHAPDC